MVLVTPIPVHNGHIGTDPDSESRKTKDIGTFIFEGRKPVFKPRPCLEVSDGRAFAHKTYTRERDT